MTERRNEDAIHRALVEWYTPVLARFGHVELVEKLVGPAATALVAEHLAAHGVLAVDSLGDDEEVTFPDPRTLIKDGPDRWVVVRGDAVRAALRRLATGEQE